MEEMRALRASYFGRFKPLVKRRKIPIADVTSGLFEAILSRSVLPTRFAVSTVLPSVLQQGVINGYINDRRTYGVNLHRISD